MIGPHPMVNPIHCMCVVEVEVWLVQKKIFWKFFLSFSSVFFFVDDDSDVKPFFLSWFDFDFCQFKITISFLGDMICSSMLFFPMKILRLLFFFWNSEFLSTMIHLIYSEFFWWFWNDDDRYQRVSQYNQSISIIDSINRYLSITKQNIKIVINLFLPTFWQTNLFFLLNQHSFSNDYFLKYRYYRDIDIECSFDYVSNLFLENKQTNNKIFQKLMMLSLLFFF